KVLIIVMILFCFGVIALIVLGRNHSELNKQIEDNDHIINIINTEITELQQTQKTLEAINHDKLQELSSWQKRHKILKEIIEPAQH
ncbi:MAG: hypothetical protein PHP11_04260, partial [Erysipelotrichaceae bacterium]|nr:hypothetical protein [Erysipelotrichaceae bacterium]